MDHKKKKPSLAGLGPNANRSIGHDFTSLASIRRSYGCGIPAYEHAKSDWHAANPGAEPRQIEAAMRRIARAVRV